MIRIITAACLLIMALVVYSPTMNTPIFFGNDRIRIIENEPYFEKGLAATFASARQPEQREALMADRPLAVISFWLNYKFAKLDAFGYRVVNVVIHAVNAFLLYLIIGAMFYDRRRKFHGLAFVGAAIYVLHPVNFIALYFISHRGLLLATMFGLLAFLSFMRYARVRSASAILWTFVFLALSVLSKQNGIIFIFVMFLYTFLFVKERRVQVFKALSPSIIFPIIILIGHILNIVHVQAWHGTWGGYVANQGVAVLYYFKNFFWPVNLHTMHVPDPFFSLERVMFICAGLAHVAILIIAFRVWRFRPLLGFAMLATYVAMIPESSIFPLTHSVAEHRAYIPYLFLSIGVVAVLKEIKCKKLLTLIAVGILCVLGVLGWQRNQAMSTEAKWLRETALNDLNDEPFSYYAIMQSLIVKGDTDGVFEVLGALKKHHPNNVTIQKFERFLINALGASPNAAVLNSLVEEIIVGMKPSMELLSLTEVLFTSGRGHLSELQMDMLRHKVVISNIEYWFNSKPNSAFMRGYPKTLRGLRTYYEAMPSRNLLQESDYQSVLAMMALWRMSPEIPYQQRVEYVLRNHPEWAVYFDNSHVRQQAESLTTTGDML